MAHHPHTPHPGHPEQDAMGVEHTHPGAGKYILIGIILTVITAIEVAAFYIPAWETSRIYVPSMLFLSTLKFALVVMFYMHLKFDHPVFRALFIGSLIVAAATLIALMFLFGVVANRSGALV